MRERVYVLCMCFAVVSGGAVPNTAGLLVMFPSTVGELYNINVVTFNQASRQYEPVVSQSVTANTVETSTLINVPADTVNAYTVTNSRGNVVAHEVQDYALGNDVWAACRLSSV